jgi:hypothetical protein
MRKKLLIALMALVAVAVSSLVWAGSSSAAVSNGAGQDAGNPGQSADITVGPYTLSPNSGGSDTQGIGLDELFSTKINFGIQAPCSNCDITSITPDLTDTSGQSVNLDSGVMLHHIVVYQSGASDVACPGLLSPAILGKRVFASGNERTTLPYTPGYGLHVPSGTTFNTLADLMNYSAQQQTVEVRFHVTWVPGNTLKSITPVWLDETSCNLLPAPSYYSIPAGPSEQSMTWTSTLNGKVIGLGGHVHPYGQHIEATDATTNTPLCDSVATQMDMGGMPMIANMSKCVGSATNGYAITDIHKGDKIQMNTFYNAPQAESLAVMGITIMYVYQT